MHWKPLGLPPGATPEEAFLKAARASQESEAVLLAWVKGFGWGGCTAAVSRPGDPDPPPGIHLMNVLDVSIVAVRRVEKKIIVPGENGNGNSA